MYAVVYRILQRGFFFSSSRWTLENSCIDLRCLNTNDIFNNFITQLPIILQINQYLPKKEINKKIFCSTNKILVYQVKKPN